MKQTSKYILAVDGGGSKVLAAAIAVEDALSLWPTCRDHCLYATRIEGTGSALISSWHVASHNILQAVTDLCERVDCAPTDISLLTLALSGAGRTNDRERVRDWAANHEKLSQIERVEVLGDIDPIVQFQSSATQWQPSIAAIVGTGSIVAAQLPGQPLVRAGGWGPTLGDEASGWALAREALRATCWWLDSAESSEPANDLVRLVIEQLVGSDRGFDRTRHRQQLSEAVLEIVGDRQRAAKLAPQILQTAFADPNSTAAFILDRQIASLVAQIQSVYRQTCSDSAGWSLLFAGGLVCNHAELQSCILSACARQELLPSPAIQVDPLVAALQYAVRIARRQTMSPRLRHLGISELDSES